MQLSEMKILEKNIINSIQTHKINVNIKFIT